MEDSTRGKLDELLALREEALHQASQKQVERRHAEGKLLARERLEQLLDPGSFVELDRYVRHREVEFEMRERRPWGDAVVTGYGDRKSTRLNSSHIQKSRMPSSA